MPGFVIPGDTALTSGGVNIMSGNFFSGLGGKEPYAGVQLKTSRSNSGNIYVTLSGGLTINSGGLNTSGLPNYAGRMDGMQLGPGDAYFVPRLAFIWYSGSPQLFAIADAATSGVGRLYMEPQ